jgi:C1A family cysteine protease
VTQCVGLSQGHSFLLENTPESFIHFSYFLGSELLHSRRTRCSDELQDIMIFTFVAVFFYSHVTKMGGYFSTPVPQRIYNWVSDGEDVFGEPLNVHVTKLPPFVDLRSGMPAVYDQGSLGSCTANAIAGAFEYDMSPEKRFIPSRLFIYYNERTRENSIYQDSGARIVDGIKSIEEQGVCPEEEWPYIEEKFEEKPPEQCYNEATKYRALSAFKVNDLNHIKCALCHGLPVVMGVQVYESFENASGGHIPLPDTSREKLLGGHAILAVGYDESQKCVFFRNSWGVAWGDRGYGTLPYDFITSFADSFWVVRTVSRTVSEDDDVHVLENNEEDDYESS